MENSDPSQWWQPFADNMSPVLQRVVKFCKKIPGTICNEKN